MNKKIISIISPCYNEESNIQELYLRVKKVIDMIENYDYEYIFIDNASTDSTVAIIKNLISIDKRLKLIVNTRNFGHIRSPYWGLIQTSGEATIYLASDLQDPPEMIPDFIKAWESGYKVALAIKPTSQSNKLMHFLRRNYYKFLDYISDVVITKDSTGFGIYDRCVVDKLREIQDPYPFLRGLINELGYKIKEIPFNQPRRIKGISKNNIYTLYDIAMLGVISHSLVPIRLAAFSGFFLSIVSIFIALALLVYKIIFWNEFAVGIAPIAIGMFFMFGILLSFIGLLGEYIGVIHTYVQKRPIVVEKERVNF
jgi:dolichol-phosphate mannosyltransferase